MEKEDDNTTSFCPSFSSYANDGLAETAERVRLEFSGESNHDDDDSFEFVNLLRSDHETTASFSGDSDVVFPMFNQIIVSKPSAAKPDDKKEESSRAEVVTTQLRDLFLRDREDSSSSSSSSDEEEYKLDGISSEIYCPWTPTKSPNGSWRKSKSTGSSSASSYRRWRIMDLLKRSYSEGKKSISFTNRDELSKKMKMKIKNEKVSSSAHEKFYLKNKAMKEEEKRRSYLPYKKHLVGLFFFNLHRRYGKTTLPSSS